MHVPYLTDELATMMIRILITAFLCGFIGFERELKKHPAGFRTHLLVGVGACLMMLLSLYGFEDYMRGHTNTQFDPSRIPSYVISGIGFLGAGTILVKDATVRGLTTAASIWIVAGLGLIIGVGMYELAIFTTVVVLLCLIFLNKFERYMAQKLKKRWVKVVVHSGETEIHEVIGRFAEMQLIVRKMQLTSSKKDKKGIITFHYLIEIEASELSVEELTNLITEVKEVEKIV